MIKYLILITGLFLMGCGGQNMPKLDGDIPFVVSRIRQFDETHSIYSPAQRKASISCACIGYNADICLPTGLYNIGDTISLIK